jgi:glucose-6-phosphate 1-dehydrogenase
MIKSNSKKPAVLVIFGAGGDLTWRKLIPALYNLFQEGNLPEHFAVIGVDQKEMDIEGFRQRLRDGIDRFSQRGKTDDKAWGAFSSFLVDYMSADFSDAKSYKTLANRLSALDNAKHPQAQHVFYLAVPPGLVETIVRHLGKAGLVHNQAQARIVVEKPFGHDLASAQTLNKILTSIFDESQIYRIDHFLGKETVQNILALRFANALFEPIWDRRYIDHVQITVAEQLGVEHRGSYYDHAGALRDMIQNHLIQLLCLIAMEPPVSFDADEIRNKKVDVLRAIRPIPPQQINQYAVRGQYEVGWIQGKRVPAYREEPGVGADSTTETFAALKLYVDNWRWQDVPFYLRTGKRLSLSVSEASIHFRSVPHQSFPASAVEDWQPNRLLIRLQPEEGILLRFQAKRPGPDVRLSSEAMRFSYQEAFKVVPPAAYETLLLDVMRGDATLFMRADQVEAAWSAVMPVVEAWQNMSPSDFPNYPAGTWGPEAAEALIARDGRSWLTPLIPEGQA